MKIPISVYPTCKLSHASLTSLFPSLSKNGIEAGGNGKRRPGHNRYLSSRGALFPLLSHTSNLHRTLRSLTFPTIPGSQTWRVHSLSMLTTPSSCLPTPSNPQGVLTQVQTPSFGEREYLTRETGIPLGPSLLPAQRLRTRQRAPLLRSLLELTQTLTL